jgi:hypothetical protein
MRPAWPFALLLLAACDPAPPGGAEPPGNDAAPAPPATQSEPATNQAAPPPDAPGESGLADMSPRQRRAYEAGLRDCSAGRYEPDRYPEAYRIGCAAAEDRKAAAPEG